MTYAKGRPLNFKNDQVSKRIVRVARAIMYRCVSCALHNSWDWTQIGYSLNELPWMSCNAGDAGNHGFDFRIRKKTWKRAWHPTAVFLPAESHGQRRLVGYSLWGNKKLDKTEVSEHAAEHWEKDLTDQQASSTPSIFQLAWGSRGTLIFLQAKPMPPDLRRCPTNVLSPSRMWSS